MRMKTYEIFHKIWNMYGQPKPPSLIAVALVGSYKSIFFNCNVDEMVGEALYENFLSVVWHAFGGVKIRVVVVDYVKVCFFLLIKKGVLYLNGKDILETTNVDHLWVLGYY
jgi:hypothetical protein